MEKIEKVKLERLVSEASKEFVEERKTRAKGLIKKQLQRIEGLGSDIRSLKKQLSKKKEQQEKALATIQKIKEGDWTAIKEDHSNKQKGESE